MQSKWIPALIPLYRPPRGGWTIQDMPEIFPEHMRQAWHERRREGNRNGQEAVLEMANFAKINGAEITKELVAAIRQQADTEWCEAEPGRCARRGAGALKSLPNAVPVAVKLVAIKQAQGKAPARQPARAPAKAKRCCGR